MALHPASLISFAFLPLAPPSISIQGFTPLASHIFFKSRILSSWESMKLCPPKPGFTDMISTRSTSARTYSIWESGVPGFRTTPAMQPKLLIWLMVRWRWMVDAASQWTEMMSAPALAKSSTRCSGSTIMRWQSSTASGCAFLRAETTPGPMVMLGTKRPSMTSTWTQSAPAFRTSPTSWPRLAKSADRIEGETWTVFSIVLSFSARGFSARTATTLRLALAWRLRAAPARKLKAPTEATEARATPVEGPLDGGWAV
mmetsp:Transcript_11334/g.21374  ORF Transcript_11334/g.21374 Transcript_11334/m.21374 type:complete len:257 (-) Transcript_11334:161-931(-)